VIVGIYPDFEIIQSGFNVSSKRTHPLGTITAARKITIQAFGIPNKFDLFIFYHDIN